MRIKFIVLVISLLLKIGFNLFSSFDYEEGDKLAINGDSYNINQNISKCIVSLDRFYADFDGYCNFSRKAKFRVIGKYKRRVIDMIFGRIYLSDAVIHELDEKPSLTKDSPMTKGYFDNLREKIVAKYYKHLPNNEASLVAGIVFGDKQGISGDLYQRMVSSGTIHIAVASGYNLMIVGSCTLTLLFWMVRRKSATLLAILVMMLYTLLSGGDPPVVRAMIMASMIFIGQALGRSQMTWWALLVTIWLMLMGDLSLISSISFQLSVMASVGLMIVEPIISRLVESSRSIVLPWLNKIGLTVTLATLLMTAPVIWLHFGRFSGVALLSNIMILPMVPILMALGGMMLVTGGWLAWPVYVVSHTMLLLIKMFSM